MKKTYLKVHDNNKKTSTGRGTVTWEYYALFCKIFDSGKAIGMNNTFSSMVVNIENNTIINPEIQKLPPLDLSTQFPSYSDTSDIDIEDPSLFRNETESISSTASGTTKKNRKRKVNYRSRKDTLELEKDRLEESKKLRASLDNMVEIQRERNQILAELSQCLQNERRNM